MSNNVERYVALVYWLRVTSLAEECENPKDVGFECAEAGKQMRFYHDKITGVCQPMFYKGCGGNENRFESAKACREQCSQTAPQRTRKGKVIKQQPLMFKDICNATYSPNIVKPLDRCKLSDTCEANYSCHQGNCCPKKEYVCKLDYDSGKEAVENVHEPRYAYNSHLNTCGRFSYFRAEGNFNNFLSFGDCMKFCGVQ
ncbi:hypothetical protein L596_021428 [Steinernema carpocapsae]|uniref:BPTI/Kunitz inhibitor domain-containing protein n=1 Tax=Steinernema carpocapsae TaxID=34508 RepID=A0A4V5ZZW5_STECR|nr:hypothetical protein L596_021428 [Steinernema carpocapsae]